MSPFRPTAKRQPSVTEPPFPRQDRLRYPQAPRLAERSARNVGVGPAGFPPPTPSTSCERTPSTWAWGTGSTTASAPLWRGRRPMSRLRSSSAKPTPAHSTPSQRPTISSADRSPAPEPGRHGTLIATGRSPHGPGAGHPHPPRWRRRTGPPPHHRPGCPLRPAPPGPGALHRTGHAQHRHGTRPISLPRPVSVQRPWKARGGCRTAADGTPGPSAGVTPCGRCLRR